MEYIRLRGLGVSPGIAIGEVQLTEKVVFTTRKETIAPGKIDSELDRLQEAIERTQEQIVKIRDNIKDIVGDEHAFIFESHLLVLQDKSLLMSLKEIIREERARAEWAISRVHLKYQKLFESIDDEYFKQRKFDVADVLSKVYRNLEPSETGKRDDGKESILVAHELLPSEAALRLSKGNVLAVALDMGGQTSHTAILARSLNIPAVMGLRNISQSVRNGDILIVDGTDGEVLINPPGAIQKEFVSKKKKYDGYRKELIKIAKMSSKTLDEFTFLPLANIELPEEVPMAFSMGAEGIGLFRSEFLYLQSTKPPSEEDHYQIYSRIVKDAHPYPVYIRTVDMGGEKNMPQLKIEKEPNPALGLRAIRLSLRDRELFRIQLRAILRASSRGNVRILIPMITELEEIEEVKLLFRDIQRELKRKKIPFDENIPIGAMIEVPAAAALTDVLAREVDYISIGTNDLIQYYLAVDRSNELVSYLFKPLHPSVLRLIKYIIDTARKENTEVTVCGEMAADTLSALFLLGLGLRKFSMNPIFIPKIKNVLRSVEQKTAQEIVEEAMKLKTAQEIEELIIERILLKHPKAFIMGL